MWTDPYSFAPSMAEPLKVGAGATDPNATPATGTPGATTPGESPDVPGPTDPNADAAENYPEVKSAIEKLQAGDGEGALEDLKAAKAAHLPGIASGETIASETCPASSATASVAGNDARTGRARTGRAQRHGEGDPR